MSQASIPDPMRARDAHVERLVGAVLRIGTLAAAAVTSLGGIIFLFHHAGSVPNYSTFAGDAGGLRTIGSVFDGALQMDGRAVIQMGLLILIATPIARVLVTLLAFIKQRDLIYVAISAIVLTILLLGFVSSGR